MKGIGKTPARFCSTISLRVIVKRILRKYGYPPTSRRPATNTVLQQAELLSDFWTDQTAPASH